MDNDLTTTQKLWQPIAGLDEEHRNAVMELHKAALENDLPGMRAASEKIRYIEGRMPVHGQDVREYSRLKALAAENGKPHPDKDNYPAIGEMLVRALAWRAEHPEYFPEDRRMA